LASIDIKESEKDVAVKLRLKRMGKKKQPTYRIVAADSRSPRDGRFIEALGTYAPRAEPSNIEVDNAKAVAWLTKGAQPSDIVRKILEISGAWDEFTATQTPKPAKPARKKSGSAKHAAKDRTAKKAGRKKAGTKKAGTKKAGTTKAAAPSATGTPAEVAARPAPPVGDATEPGEERAETTAVVDGGDD
jgi:small subunit ribosomal protein S16